MVRLKDENRNTTTVRYRSKATVDGFMDLIALPFLPNNPHELDIRTIFESLFFLPPV